MSETPSPECYRHQMAPLTDKFGTFAHRCDECGETELLPNDQLDDRYLPEHGLPEGDPCTICGHIDVDTDECVECSCTIGDGDEPGHGHYDNGLPAPLCSVACSESFFAS